MNSSIVPGLKIGVIMSPAVKVLELVRSLDKGGRTGRLLMTARGLRQKGYEVTVGTFFDSPQWVKEQWPESRDWVRFDRRRGVDLRLVLQLRAWMRQNRIQILHTHCEESTFHGGLAARLAGVPALSTFHRSDLNYYRKTWKNTLWNGFLARKVAISLDRQRRMVSSLKIPSKQIELIHGAVDLETFRPVASAGEREALRKTLRIPPDRTVLLGIGHLAPIKGHDVTVRAVSELLPQYPGIMLYLAGDGTKGDYERLRTLVASLNMDNHVVFLGQITNPSEWLQACDLFIQPSLEEGFGLVFAEAGACGKGAIATMAGGIPDIIIPGETGILVPPGDVSALSQAIHKLLKSPELEKQLGENAHLRVIRNFSTERMVSQYDALIQNIIANR